MSELEKSEVSRFPSQKGPEPHKDSSRGLESWRSKTANASGLGVGL